VSCASYSMLSAALRLQHKATLSFVGTKTISSILCFQVCYVENFILIESDYERASTLASYESIPHKALDPNVSFHS
jgi:hypothetical protein